MALLVKEIAGNPESDPQKVAGEYKLQRAVTDHHTCDCVYTRARAHTHTAQRRKYILKNK